MATIALMPVASYPSGSREVIGTIPAAFSWVELVVDISAMTDPATSFDLELDFSRDGGTTWASDAPSAATEPFPLRGTWRGGVHLDRQGQPQALCRMMGCALRGSGVTGRRIKFKLVITGPITIGASLTVT